MLVGVVIPCDSATVLGQGDRGTALPVVARSIKRWHDGPIGYGSPLPTEPWSKGVAVADALGVIDRCDVLVVHDADVFTLSGEAMTLAIDVVASGKAKWAIPHDNVHRLSKDSTAQVLAGERMGEPVTLTRAAYTGIAGGGIVALGYDTYLDCPIDPRFEGWGSEDEAWGWALEALHGPPWRGSTDLIHLYHQHPAPGLRRSPRFESEQLWRRYRAFKHAPVAMRGLVDQASAQAFPGGRPISVQG